MASQYHVALYFQEYDASTGESVGDRTDLGYIVMNAPPDNSAERWKSFGDTSTYFGSAKGKWVVGHARGKSPQDSYYLDDQGNEILMLASFIPRYDHAVGYKGHGRLLNPK